MALTSASQSSPTPRDDEFAASEASIPALLGKAVCEHGPRIAMRWKRRGVWEAVTWTEYGTAVRAVADALEALSIQPGERIAILSGNRPEWLHVDLGALSAGCVTVGIDVRQPADRIVDALKNCGARLAFVDGEEQLEAALGALSNVPTLERIVCFDEHFGPVEPRTSTFAAFLASGRASSERSAAPAEIARPAAADAAAMSQAEAMARLYPGMPGDEQLSVLPLARLDERCFTIYRPLVLGSIVNFGEGPANVLDSFREVAPHVVMALPDVWEQLHATVVAAIADASPIGRLGYRMALGIGSAVADHQAAERPIPLPLRIGALLARLLVLNRVRTMIGLRRARVLISLETPTPPELTRWYSSLGLRIVAQGQSAACTESADSQGAALATIRAR